MNTHTYNIGVYERERDSFDEENENKSILCDLSKLSIKGKRAVAMSRYLRDGDIGWLNISKIDGGLKDRLVRRYEKENSS